MQVNEFYRAFNLTGDFSFANKYIEFTLVASAVNAEVQIEIIIKSLNNGDGMEKYLVHPVSDNFVSLIDQ